MKTILSVVTLVVMMVTMSSEAEAAQCKVELKNGRGRLLEVFRGQGYDRYDACQEAKQDCRRVKRSGYYRARILTCEVKQNRHRRMVQKTCHAVMTGPRGHRTIQTFLGHARGLRGSGGKALACGKALKQCRKAKRRSGRYNAVCRAENGSGRYGRSLPPRRNPLPVPRRGGRRGGLI